MKRKLFMGAMALAMVATAAASAHATPELFMQARKAGMPASNCQYCHTIAMPKKDSFKPEDLNARGKWLIDEKDKTKASAVDGAWLKDYPGGK
jgi:hypothetical protein